MTTDFDKAWTEVDEVTPAVAIARISVAYSTRLAINLLEAHERPFTRIVEDVRTEAGECLRQLTIDWSLPTLREALPDAELVPFASELTEPGSTLVVPLLPIGKQDMMSDFVVTGAAGERLYVCGQDESVRHTRLVLETLWQWVERVAPRTHAVKTLREDFYTLPALSVEEASECLRSIEGRVADLKIPANDPLLERVLLIARYVAKYHIIWLRLPCRPGDSTRLTLTCRTRFVADHAPRREGVRALFRYLIDWARRVSGQEPYRYAIPAWTSSLCRSYHFQMSAPPAMYFADQRFTLEKHLYDPENEQQRALEEQYGQAHFSGRGAAGGAVAHMYVRNLPVAAENALYAYARLRERPPGSTAHVMWLATLTAGFLWFFYFSWTSMAQHDTQGIDLASLAVALLAVASIWFSRAFRDDVRSRVPLVSRLGLLLVGGSTVYSLLTILFHRVTCIHLPKNPQVCPEGWSTVFSRAGFLSFGALMTTVVILLFIRMIDFHRGYQKLQAKPRTNRAHPRTKQREDPPSPAMLLHAAKAALTRQTPVRPEVSGEPIFTVPGLTPHVRLPNLIPPTKHPTATEMLIKSAIRNVDSSYE